MKKWKLHELVPPWVDGEKHAERLYTCLLLSGILSFMGFGLSLVVYRGWLYDGSMIPFYSMLIFPILPASVFSGFFLLSISALVLATVYYHGFSQGSESLYLMRRLPDRWELARRCLALPLITIALSALSILVLTLVFLGIYCLLASGEISITEQLKGMADNIHLLFLPISYPVFLFS